MKQFTLCSILFLGLILFSCKDKPRDSWTDTLTSGFIKIACDEDFKALMDAEIQSFGAHNQEAFINPVYTTEANAIDLLIEDSVRFALVTRDLNKAEKAKLAERGMEAKRHTIAFDGIAIINNQVNADSIIGLPVLKKILTGEITEWSQINPNTKYGTIRVIFNNKESGVLRYVADSILRGEANSPNLYALNSNTEVLEKVAEMPNSIGIIGVNILSDENNLTHHKHKDKIRIMRVSKDENTSLENSYLPYAGDIAQESYPLWRPVYVLVSDPRSGLSAGLSIFMSNEIGQKIILKSGLLPVTDQNVMKVLIINENPN